MDLNEFLDYVNSGKVVKAGSEISEQFNIYLDEAMRITSEINSKYHSFEEIQVLFAELTSKEINETLRLTPPFRCDCGKNIHIGENVFINSNCVMQDQGGIYIGDNVLIGQNVSLLTLNHDEIPEKRADIYPKPIHIGDNAWLGANVTVLPGVSIGAGAIVGAGAVVTKDVEEDSVVAGVPARFIRKVKKE